MLRIENLCNKYNSRVVFNNLNLTVNKGEVIGIIGASGSGKSTLLKSILLLREFESGHIYFKDTEITKKSIGSPAIIGKIGLIFQNANSLFYHLSVINNITCGLIDIKHMKKKDAYEKAEELLKLVGLNDKANDYPGTLSGGQQQRLSIARAYALDPELILMDEPTSALDPLAKKEVETVIKLMADKGETIIIVSHELELIKNVCSKVVFLNDGYVYEEGTPSEVLDNPKKDATRRFVKALRVLELSINSSDFDFIGLSTTLSEYAYRTSMPHSHMLKMHSVLEELFHVFIIDSKENNKLKILLEYNDKEDVVYGTVFATGDEIDTDNPYFYVSWKIIEKRTQDLEITRCDTDGFTNLLKFRI